MKIKWLGHSAFLLSASDGTRVITDPYVPGSFDGGIRYRAIDDTCDGVTVSHDHADHNGCRGLPGKPAVIRGEGEHRVGTVPITGFATWHDEDRGRRRGDNTVFVFEVDGLRVCHAGDLGHVLPAPTVAGIGRVDVLMVPVGGYFTIGPDGARAVARQLGAKVTIPMHYRTDRCDFDIAPVDDFLAGQPGVRRTGASEVEVGRDTLPAEPETWVFEHAR